MIGKEEWKACVTGDSTVRIVQGSARDLPSGFSLQDLINEFLT